MNNQFEKEVMYTAVFHDDGDLYVVTFPDVKDCITSGHTLEVAYINAQEALGCALFDLNGDYPKYITSPKDVELKEGDYVFLVTPMARSKSESDILLKRTRFRLIHKRLNEAKKHFIEIGFSQEEIDRAIKKLEFDLINKKLA